MEDKTYWIEGAYFGTCSNCGKVGFPDWVCCPYCGKEIERKEPEKDENNA